MTSTSVTADPLYRPENVRVQHFPEGGAYGPRMPYLVVDFDGMPMRWHATRSEADETAKHRRAVMKAAITRSRNRTGR